jgi:hypothetical protein
MTPLAYKLIGKQFDALAEVYGTWMTAEAHESVVRDDDVTTSLVNRWPGDIGLAFTVKVGQGGGTVRFIALYKDNAYHSHVIDAMGTLGSMEMHIEALGKLTTFVHKYLETYATENGFPPENVMH